MIALRKQRQLTALFDTAVTQKTLSLPDLGEREGDSACSVLRTQSIYLHSAQFWTRRLGVREEASW